MVFALTCFLSFLVQSLFYPFYKKTNPQLVKNHKTVFNYLSGVVGDGLLVPLTNVFAVQTLIYLGITSISTGPLILALLIGATLTSIVHFNQQSHGLLNWTMPEKGQWNTLGLYHAIFMFSEISFLAYVLLIQMGNFNSFLYSPIKLAFLSLGLFLLTFIYDYRKTLLKPTFFLARYLR